MIRPQPIGRTPWPHGALLLPTGPGVAEFADAVVRCGADARRGVPDGLAFWLRAAEGELDAALDALPSVLPVEDPLVAYDRFVLDPSAEGLAELRRDVADPGLRALIEIAALQSGLDTTVPTIEALDGELLAYGCTALATCRLAGNDLDGALALLAAGVEAAIEPSPGLAAQILMSRAEVERRRTGSTAGSIETLRRALAVLPGGEAPGFVSLRAELCLELGALLQESGAGRAAWTEAIELLEAAASRLGPQDDPRAHGFARMRIGLARLELGEDREGIAALARAVEVWSPDREPDLWCAAASNLAKACRNSVSGDFAEDLDRAIELYGRILEVRDADREPAAVGRILVERAEAATMRSHHRAAIADWNEALPLLRRAELHDEYDAAARMLEDARQFLASAGE